MSWPGTPADTTWMLLLPTQALCRVANNTQVLFSICNSALAVTQAEAPQPSNSLGSQRDRESSSCLWGLCWDVLRTLLHGLHTQDCTLHTGFCSERHWCEVTRATGTERRQSQVHLHCDPVDILLYFNSFPIFKTTKAQLHLCQMFSSRELRSLPFL